MQDVPCRQSRQTAVRGSVALQYRVSTRFFLHSRLPCTLSNASYLHGKHWSGWGCEASHWLRFYFSAKTQACTRSSSSCTRSLPQKHPFETATFSAGAFLSPRPCFQTPSRRVAYTIDVGFRKNTPAPLRVHIPCVHGVPRLPTCWYVAAKPQP